MNLTARMTTRRDVCGGPCGGAPGGRSARGALIVGLLLLASAAPAQRVREATGFELADYYAAPHDTQMKSLLQGARFQPLPGGRTLLTQAKLQTFTETGEHEMTVEAPQCLHDAGSHSISSSGPLRAQTGDGRFSIEGEGFLWLQANSSLVISNRVHTVVQPEFIEPGSSAPRPRPPAAAGTPFDIYSDQFAYSEDSAQGVYQGHVRVSGTNLALTAERLTISLPQRESHKPSSLERITADQNVVVDSGGVCSTGERAVYSPDTGLVEVSGHPSWHAEQREGRADELIID